jgi:hypothetical protein
MRARSGTIRPGPRAQRVERPPVGPRPHDAHAADPERREPLGELGDDALGGGALLALLGDDVGRRARDEALVRELRVEPRDVGERALALGREPAASASRSMTPASGTLARPDGNTMLELPARSSRSSTTSSVRARRARGRARRGGEDLAGGASAGSTSSSRRTDGAMRSCERKRWTSRTSPWTIAKRSRASASTRPAASASRPPSATPRPRRCRSAGARRPR